MKNTGWKPHALIAAPHKVFSLVYGSIYERIDIDTYRCLRYILRIWWPNFISKKDLWKVTGEGVINLEIRKRKFR